MTGGAKGATLPALPIATRMSAAATAVGISSLVFILSQSGSGNVIAIVLVGWRRQTFPFGVEYLIPLLAPRALLRH